MFDDTKSATSQAKPRQGTSSDSRPAPSLVVSPTAQQVEAGPSLLQALIEGSLEVKLPTICRDGKAEVGRVREEKSRSEKIREKKEWEARRCRCAKR